MTPVFMRIETCAELAGYSLRQIRRLLAQDGVRMIEFRKGRFRVLTADFEKWNKEKNPRRENEAVQASA